MSRWRDQLNAVGSNAFDFVQRISNELATESEIDPATELQYHKDQAMKLERDFIKCQSELAERNKEIETLTHSVQEAHEEVELTRQTFLNRIAAKELELEKAQHEIEKMRDAHNFSDWSENGHDSSQIELELEVVRAEKAALSDQLTSLTKQLEETKRKQTDNFDSWSNPMVSSDEIDELKAELNNSNERTESLRQEMSRLIEKNQALLSECSERQEVCQRLEHQLTAIQTMNATAHSAELDNLRSQIAKYEDENRKIRQQLDDVIQQNQQLLKAHSSPAQVNEGLEYVELLAKEMLRTQSLVQTSLLNMKELKSNSQSDNEVHKKLAVAQKELAEYRHLRQLAKSCLNDENSTETSNIDGPLSTESWNEFESDNPIPLLVKSCVQQAKIYRDQCKVLNKQLSETIKQHNSETITNSEKMEFDLKNQNETLKQQLIDASEQLAQILADKRLAVDEAQLLSRKVDDLSSQLNEMTEQLNQAGKQEGEVTNSAQELENMCAENQALQKEHQRLETELQCVAAQAEEYVSVHKAEKEELEAKVNDANETIKRYTNQLQEQAQAFETERVAIRQAVTEEFMHRLDVANKQLEEYETDRNKLIQFYESAKEASNQNANHYQNLVSECCFFVESIRAQSGLSIQPEHTTDLKEALHQLSVDINQKITEIKNHGDKTIADLQKQLTELNSTIDRLKHENEYLQGCNVSNEQRIESIQTENDRLKAETVATEEKLHELISERKNLVEGTAEAEIYRRYTQDKIEKKQQELDEANARIQQKETENEYYRLNLEKQQMENEQLQKKVNGISMTVKDLQSTYVECQNQLRVTEEVSAKQISDLSELISELQTEKEATDKNYEKVIAQLQVAENRIQDLQAEVELLENRKPSTNSPTTVQEGSSVDIKATSASTFSVPPILRQFIISAVTCEEQQRADGALLLANLIGCTAEEKQRIEQSYRPKSGWGSFFGGQKQSAAQHPQNFRELYQQFVEFLERESSLTTVTPANVESKEPMMINNDLEPPQLKSGSSSTELRKILDNEETSSTT
ncbi:hypothetical protein M3Y96_00835400 [Aphelenchoides besseyi]|nr:hypothetical protein M3Y96_00835400 [Aphelenchoides besseyi]